jgi:uncharacterized protein
MAWSADHEALSTARRRHSLWTTSPDRAVRSADLDAFNGTTSGYGEAMANRLVHATSPYLLQHAANPVDWHEWGDDAFSASRQRDVPVFLSVGYAACHWCHVMAHESFEDPDTAEFLNERFVSVKVDREERPDVDRIYMDAVQAISGQGGWPMTVFLTPDAKPFYAGTYFPKESRGPYPSFRRVLESVDDAWRHRRSDLAAQAERLTAAVAGAIPPAAQAVDVPAVVEAGVAGLLAAVDGDHGGFGGAPKFPQVPSLELLVRSLALHPDGARAEPIRGALQLTLDRMARGGIYDHLGGGFARYAVDRTWLVPHFEKMLYDNAQLARLYLRAWQVLGHDRYRAVAEETLDYLLDEMRDPQGGLHSAEDADSEGVEGKYYVWSLEEMAAVLGDDTDAVAAVYGATAAGNFEGANILHRPEPLASVAARLGLPPAELEKRRAAGAAALRLARSLRVRPGRDDKIVTAWNGLAVRALAEAGAVLVNERYLAAAREIADFVITRMRDGTGRLARTWRSGRLGPPGYCDDYAALAVGLYSLYQATGELRWFVEAERTTADMVALFADPDGGFFATGSDAERLIARPKNLQDNPTPSDNSLAAEALLIHAAFTGDGDGHARIDGIGRAAAALLERFPAAVGHLLAVLASQPVDEVAIVGSPKAREPFVRVIWGDFRPASVVAVAEGPSDAVPLLAGRTTGAGALAYVCHGFACDLPVADPADLEAKLRR